MSPLDRIANSLENIAQSLAQLVQRGDAFPSSAPKPADSSERRGLTPDGITLDFTDLAKPIRSYSCVLCGGFVLREGVTVDGKPAHARCAEHHRAAVNIAAQARANTFTAPVARGLGDFPPLDTMKGDLSDPVDPWGSGL